MILNEDLGFNKKIDKFNKCIDKLETKNNKHIPKNDKQKEYKKELKEYIRILRNNSKELKKLNDYEFDTEEQKKNAKEIVKKLLRNQKNFITGTNNAGFIGFLKELGLGTVMGAIIGGFSYLLNSCSYNEHNSLLLGPGARVYAAGKNLYNELDIKKIMTYDAAEKGLWTTLAGTAMAAGADHSNSSSLSEFKFNLPDKKNIKEEANYFPY